MVFLSWMTTWFRQLYYRVIRPVGVVRLPTGFLVRVRKLKLFELDCIPFNQAEPFTYTYHLPGGKTKEAVYDISQWPEPPKPPKVPKEVCDPQSMEAALWKVYDTYQSALLHRIREVSAGEEYAFNIARYILQDCLSESDRALVQTPNDYELIYQMALTPEVTLGDLKEQLRQTFSATYDGQPVLEEYFNDKSSDSKGKVAAIRLWEFETMREMGKTKEEWAEIPKKDRAQYICGFKLPDWLSELAFRDREKENK